MKKKMSVQCYGCKGYGHTKNECISNLSGMSAVSNLSDTESEDDDGDDILNHFVSHFGVIDLIENDDKGGDDDTGDTVTANQSVDDQHKTIKEGCDSDSDEELNMSQEDQLELLVTSLVETKDDNKQLKIEKPKLEDQLKKAQKDLSAARSQNLLLENKLSEQLKQVKMMSNGTKDLDYLLSVGRSEATSRGLGYEGGATHSTKFVKATNPYDPDNQIKRCQYHDQQETVRQSCVGWRKQGLDGYYPNNQVKRQQRYVQRQSVNQSSFG